MPTGFTSLLVGPDQAQVLLAASWLGLHSAAALTSEGHPRVTGTLGDNDPNHDDQSGPSQGAGA